MQLKIFNLSALLALAVVLTACGDDGVRPGNNSANNNNGTYSSNSNDVSTGSINAVNDSALEDMNGDASLRDTRTIYFAYDSTQIGEEYRETLAAHAQYLRANPQIRARIEGHADERGSREYNLGLGQRRAQAVRQFMMLTGVAGSQLVAISYGEEKPADFAHNESAWSENRRVFVKY